MEFKSNHTVHKLLLKNFKEIVIIWKKSQEKLLKKIENNKKIALAKAAALLGKNKTKIASMTGIYIP